MLKDNDNQPQATKQTDRQAQGAADTEVEVHDEFSKIRSRSRFKILLIVLVVILNIGILYFVLSKIFLDQPNDTQNGVSNLLSSPVNKTNTESTDNITIPVLPEMPKIITPDLPPINPPVIKQPSEPATIDSSITSTTPSIPAEPVPPIAPPPITAQPLSTPPVVDLSQSAEEKQRRSLEKRTSTNTIVINRSMPQPTQHELDQSANFTDSGNLKQLLSRGTTIDAVIINAVNSNLSSTSEIMAMITNDVYASEGKLILIPRGSKVFGQVSNLGGASYGRIIVTWEQIQIAGTQYKLNLSSPTIDNLGRPGTQGTVNNKVVARILHSVLVSAANVGAAYLLDKANEFVAPGLANTGSNSVVSSLVKNAIAIRNKGDKDSKQKIIEICNTSTNSIITNKQSELFKLINNKCTEVQANSSDNDDKKLDSIMNAIINAATTSAASVDQTSNTRTATNNALSTITESLKAIVPEQDLNRVITLKQGHHIKIYVNRDYLFPSMVLKNTNIVG